MFESLYKKQLQSIARALMNALGGFLVANAILTPDESAALIAAGIPVIVKGVPIAVAVGWSLYDNRKTQKKIVRQEAVIDAIRHEHA